MQEFRIIDIAENIVTTDIPHGIVKSPDAKLPEQWCAMETDQIEFFQFDIVSADQIKLINISGEIPQCDKIMIGRTSATSNGKRFLSAEDEYERDLCFARHLLAKGFEPPNLQCAENMKTALEIPAMSKTHLSKFMDSATREMANDFSRLAKCAKEDPGLAGRHGEGTWKAFLENWLPPAYPIVTDKRILFLDGSRSQQWDVLVLHPMYPKGLLDREYCLAAGVTAAFECKLNLRAGDITEALENCIDTRKKSKPINGSPFKELHGRFVCGLLAQSHSWKKANSDPIGNISNQIYKKDLSLVQHPYEMLDLICVSDLATWKGQRNLWKAMNFPILNNLPIQQSDTYVSTAYLCASGKSGECPAFETAPEYAPIAKEHSFSPVGTLIQQLWSRFAWDEPKIRGIGHQITSELGRGVRSAEKGRKWDKSVMTKSTLKALEQIDDFNPPWDEWCGHFW